MSIELRPRAQRRAKISALGTYVPPRILSNADLTAMVDTSDEWIMQRLGIRERHLVEPGMATSDMAVEAARRCLAFRGIPASEVEVVIVATVTPDMFFPATACLVQDKLGAHGAWGFDLSAACSGFLYALQVGAKLVESGVHSKVLVIGADTMSSIIDYTDRTTCVIFGDGAGAVLVEPTEEGEIGLIDFHHEIDGSGAAALNMPGRRQPLPRLPRNSRGKIALRPSGRPGSVQVRGAQDGRDRGQGFDCQPHHRGDLGCFIPHQANKRIILSTAERLGLPLERVVINIDRFGNTTAATIPLAMQTALDEHRLQRDSLVLLASVGAGFTVGACLLRWEL